MPILQLSLSSTTLSEQEVGDFGTNFIRTQLATVQGAAVPWPFGGKTPQIMVDINPALLQSKGLSPQGRGHRDHTAELILPAGTSKIGPFEYNVDMNASPKTVAELNDLPLKAVDGTTLYIRDVGSVRNGFAPQANVVRRDGRRGALSVVYKAGNASTLDIVQGVKDVLPRPARLGAQQPQNRSDGRSVDLRPRGHRRPSVREAIIAACLTGVMILLFLGNWRSTLIVAISIPLSILSSILALRMLHETINIMTLGGLALAVGILVDDATVTIENIERFIERGVPLEEAIFEGAAQISVPALVSTLCICIVFLPMFFLSGVPKYLFAPLAESVVFAMLASYVLSRTLVPTLAKFC